jgi:hypothetical protein
MVCLAETTAATSPGQGGRGAEECRGLIPQVLALMPCKWKGSSHVRRSGRGSSKRMPVVVVVMMPTPLLQRVRVRAWTPWAWA